MKQAFTFKIFLAMLITLPLVSQGQSIAEKVTKDTITVEDFAEVRIENEYGDVVISTWEKPSIAYEFLIRVEKRDLDAAEDLLERVQVDVSNFGRLVTISSSIADREDNFFTRLLSDIPLELDKSDVTIDLNISIPNEVDLEIINSFGDVVILDFIGKLRCNLKHGNLKVTEDLKTIDLDHSYGRVDLRSTGLAKFNLRNSRLSAESITDLQLDSQGSELQIQTIDYLNLDSNKDEMRIVEVEKIRGDMRFGNIFIEEMGQELSLELRVTDLRITEINNSNPNIYIDQQNSDVDITIHGAAFNLKANLEEGVLRLPESFKNIQSDIIDNKANKRIITGNFGPQETTGLFELRGKRGYVILREE